MTTVNQLDLKNKKAIIRVDFNVPLNDAHQVTDNTRIVAAKPTIDAVLSAGGSCILMSHLGRPKGVTPELSLQHIISAVEEVLGHKVIFAQDSIGEDAQSKAAALKPGEILLLENLRFHAEETAGDEGFAKALASLADVYINDAFGTAHRAHVSTTIIAQYFDQNKAVGNLLEQEIIAIDKVLKTGEKPVLAILGGSKVSSKITIIENILDKVDHLIIGGGMAYTFVKAKGGKVGNSICEGDYLEYTLELLEKAKAKNVQIHLPVDVIATTDFSNDKERKTMNINEIEDGWEGLDAGPISLQNFENVVLESKTILWNGPLGVFEFSNFANGTIKLGTFIAQSTTAGAFSLVGGGDSVAAVKQFGFADKVSYVSTGGGAMLESLEGKILPGIAALKA
ncbi:MAG: phosphoglycerate kinase [Flavobacteriaceae bacterium]|nr:phosphoglycerate kinase [Flavobacteriaceae bacterium]